MISYVLHLILRHVVVFLFLALLLLLFLALLLLLILLTLSLLVLLTLILGIRIGIRKRAIGGIISDRLFVGRQHKVCERALHKSIVQGHRDPKFHQRLVIRCPKAARLEP